VFVAAANPLPIAAVNGVAKSQLMVLQANWVGRPVLTLVGAPAGAGVLGSSNCSPSCTIGMSFRVTTGPGVYTWRMDVRQVAGGPVVGSLSFLVTVT
jgi:hypothetical protein